MSFRFCDERDAGGFSWIVDEPATRTSHALVASGRVWLVDPVDWPEAVERAAGIGEPAAVVQLLDRHNRDCAAVARRLGIPHLVTPSSLPGSPYETIEIRRTRHWHEVALWDPATATLVVAETLGTNAFYTGGAGVAGVHLLMRLRPPRRALAGRAPEHLLVGHGEGVHVPEASRALDEALRTSRTGLPRALLATPGLLLDAYRRRA